MTLGIGGCFVCNAKTSANPYHTTYPGVCSWLVHEKSPFSRSVGTKGAKPSGLFFLAHKKTTRYSR